MISWQNVILLEAILHPSELRTYRDCFFHTFTPSHLSDGAMQRRVETTSRKRVRVQGKEDSIDSAEGDAAKVFAIEAARSGKRYEEAINVATDVLEDELLSRRSRIKFLFVRCSVYAEMKDGFFKAVQDAQQAISLSPEDAKVSHRL
jgi:hypothetical protein